MYGWDRGDRRGLAGLLRRLNKVDILQWIRVLYVYPNSIYDSLLDSITESEKVINYIDIPLQSASREVLKRMKRGGNRKSLTRTIDRIRSRIPDVTIRTTIIVGFPGETESDFGETCDFIREIEFDRLGVFAFSDEEHADSYRLDNKVSEDEKSNRVSEIMHLQAEISKRKNQAKVGLTVPVLVEGPSDEIDILWQGRMSSQAPDIDGIVYLNDGITGEIRPGNILPVEITEAHEYDLIGRVLN
jgi:ribosomal protein S12 methylthiotransferase